MRLPAPIALALLITVLAPERTWAGQLQLTFGGAWTFHDSFAENPDFWNAMNASGVFEGSPLTFSLVVSNVDIDSDPTVGLYRVVKSQLRVGAVVLTSGPTWLRVSNDPTGSDVFMVGTWAGPPAGPYKATYMQMTLRSSVASSDKLADVMANVGNVGVDLLFVGYSSDNCALCLGTTRLALTSISVRGVASSRRAPIPDAGPAADRGARRASLE